MVVYFLIGLNFWVRKDLRLNMHSYIGLSDERSNGLDRFADIDHVLAATGLFKVTFLDMQRVLWVVSSQADDTPGGGMRLQDHRRERIVNPCELIREAREEPAEKTGRPVDQDVRLVRGG